MTRDANDGGGSGQPASPVPLLALRNVSKTFPGVRALDDVSLELHAGEVHMLLGENGAGKSTLIKVLYGAYRADAGTILYEGKPVDIARPADARRLGIAVIFQEFSLVPFLDLAYQGFGDGIDADGIVVRKFAATSGPLFISSSFSKSFSLYGERVGACTIVASDKDEAARVLSQVKRIVRANYSNPPTHGGQIVAMALTSAQLREIWEIELGGMRERIRAMREALVAKLAERAPGVDFDFVRKQRGMFSYSGLNREQVQRLRDEFSIYAVDTGRICVAALNSKNIEYVADSIAAVLGHVPVPAPATA